MLLAFDEKEFSKNEIILRVGDVQKELYFVKEGVQMSYFYLNVKKHVMAFIFPPYPSGAPVFFQSERLIRRYITKYHGIKGL